MTLDEANRIAHIWGRYIEYCQDRLRALFIAGIPESLLPYPLETIEEAINIASKHYHDAGDLKASKLLTDSLFRCLVFYKDDETALKGAAVKFNLPNVREAISSNMKAVQKSWIKTVDFRTFQAAKGHEL